ncbi:3-oxoacyl-ACP synthase III family protein [Thalassococcus lentus]|uniref:Ketoacyl-ACP synthase III n=1 Tax=Thalassococcus lentus TaxID=1210524 RepID=A0ABT4XMX0_9RHOB|nr:3-oxoacyl-[acyl-carrier-protein] synthase III C-terminal domain-containing protein [Thalassococcus lentus]MDA7423294.1 ketoacyl-ACP synthase III [Thalassococcus lentus]
MHHLPISITGTGHALPQKGLDSETLDKMHGLKTGWLRRKSGVAFRHLCTDEDQIDLAVLAAQRAMEDARVEIDNIDLILSGSAIPYQSLPATAPLIMQRLGAKGGAAAAFDVNATCLSFVTALDLAAGRIALGQSKRALVISSEIASRALPWQKQPDVAALFGDGAAAAVVSAPLHNEAGIRASLVRTHPAAYDACQIGAGGTRIDYHRNPKEFAENALFRMDGKALFKVTRRHFPAFVETLLDKAGWRKSDVDVVVPHQASPHALSHMSRKMGFRQGSVMNVAEQLGNQIAASIPTVLDIARREGRIVKGSKVLLLGTSAGVSFGGMAIEV